jgi:VWFA-related protein
MPGGSRKVIRRVEGEELRAMGRRERRIRQGAGSLLALALGLGLAGGPAPARAQQDRSRIRTAVEMVVVPVTVKDSQGQSVDGLIQDDFAILEDGVEQRIAFFSASPFPLSAVLLIDNNLTEREARQLQESLVALSAGFSRSDAVALMVFDQYPKEILPLTGDPDQLFTQLKRLRLGSQIPGSASAPWTSGPRINRQPVGPGVPTPPAATISAAESKNIDDAVYAAAQLLLHQPRDRRKIILLISDGNNSRHNTEKFDAVAHVLLSSDISVYAIDAGAKVLDPKNVLARYAKLTGGDLFHADKRGKLEPLFSRVTDQARNQYTLGYIPQGTNRAKEYHSLEVRVHRPGLTILARDGYFTGGLP